MHEKKEIRRHVRFCKDNNFIALVKVIGFVKWQVKGKLSWKEGEGVVRGIFLDEHFVGELEMVISPR